jgi:hypothetical protein
MSYAAFTAAAPADPAALLAPLPVANKLRGNRNFALAPHRGARTRAGCPCRSPAIHGNHRCRMHGGRNPGPRAPESLPRRRPGVGIRVRETRTIHGTFGSNASAENHDRRTLLRIGRVGIALDRYQVHLPPAPSADREPRGAPTPASTAPFKPFRIDPMNREPAAKPGSTAPFKPFRIDPMNREPGAFPGPDPLRPGHRFHAHARSRQSTRRAALTAPAPQARNFAADERR